MAEPAAENDEDYMTMDADQWSEDDNTYEVADTLGIDYSATRGSREQQPSPVFRGKNIEALKNQRVAINETLPNIGNQSAATNRPPSLRYMTIRWPGFNANKGKKQPPELGKTNIQIQTIRAH